MSELIRDMLSDPYTVRGAAGDLAKVAASGGTRKIDTYSDPHSDA